MEKKWFWRREGEKKISNIHSIFNVFSYYVFGLSIQFNSIQEAREVHWAPRSKWGTPSRSRLDQGFSAWHSLDLTSGITTQFEPWFRINQEDEHVKKQKILNGWNSGWNRIPPIQHYPTLLPSNLPDLSDLVCLNFYLWNLSGPGNPVTRHRYLITIIM